jgi:hypothetical protein
MRWKRSILLGTFGNKLDRFKTRLDPSLDRSTRFCYRMTLPRLERKHLSLLLLLPPSLNPNPKPHLPLPFDRPLQL